MKSLRLKELKSVNGRWYIPFYKENYSDNEFNRCGIYHIHNIFSPDQFIYKKNGKFEDIGRRNAEAIALVRLNGIC